MKIKETVKSVGMLLVAITAILYTAGLAFAQSESEKVNQLFDGIYIVTSTGDIKEAPVLNPSYWRQAGAIITLCTEDFSKFGQSDVKGFIIKGSAFIEKMTYATAKRERRSSLFSREKGDFNRTVAQCDLRESISADRIRKRSAGEAAIYMEFTDRALYGDVKEGQYLLMIYTSTKARESKVWMVGLDAKADVAEKISKP